MYKLILKIALGGVLLFAFTCTAAGQDTAEQTEQESGTATKILNGTARTTYIVVGTTARYGWKATKFTAGKVVKPVIVKAAPAAGKFLLKQSGTVIKKSFPVIKKTAFTYLKFRLSP